MRLSSVEHDLIDHKAEMNTRDANEVTPPNGKYRWLLAEVSFKENTSTPAQRSVWSHRKNSREIRSNVQPIAQR